MKPKHFNCSVWRADVFYFMGWKEAEFIKYCRKHYNHDPQDLNTCDGRTLQLTHNRGDGFAIWVRRKRGVLLLAHEAIHCAGWILHNRGYKYDIDNDEPFAYLVQRIIEVGLE